MDSLACFPIPAHTRFRGHEHHGPHVCVVLDGGFVERDGRSWRHVGAGTIRVSGPSRHDIDFGPEGARCLVLTADTESVAPALCRPGQHRFLESDGWLSRLVGRIDRTTAVADSARAHTLDGLATELLAQLERRIDGRSAPPPPWLRRVREKVEDQGGAVRVASLAEEAGVHRVHLARAFRDHFGIPVTEYARHVRLGVAQRLLLASPLSLAQVAAHAGFADQSHLTRVMRARLGITPGSARRGTLHPFKTMSEAPG